MHIVFDRGLMRVLTRLIAGLCASFVVRRGLYACSPGSTAPGPLLLLAPSTQPRGYRCAAKPRLKLTRGGLAYAGVGVVRVCSTAPAGVCPWLAYVFSTHTEGGDPGSLHEKKIKVKDLESETGNTLDLSIAFYLTSQNMERFCILKADVVYAYAQRGDNRVRG